MQGSFTIKEHEFKVGKVGALEQFHIARRFGPVIGEIMPALGSIAQRKDELDKLSQEEQFNEMMKAVTPAINALSKLSDADSEYVLFGLLSAVEYHQKEHKVWIKMASKKGFNVELDFPLMMQVAGRSFMANLTGFLASRPHNA
jgi:hypothetical protein